MRMFKKVLAGFVAAAMVATMAGCGSSNSSTKDSGSDKAAAEATTEAAAPAKVLNTNAANKLIYCITPSTSNPYFGTVQTACKEEGEKLAPEFSFRSLIDGIEIFLFCMARYISDPTFYVT